MDRPTLPAPAMTTRMGDGLSGQCAGGGASRTRSAIGEVLAPERDVEEVALLVDGVRPRDHPVAQPGEVGEPAARGRLDVGHPPADPARRHRHLGDDDLARRVGELGHVALGEQSAQHLVAGPLHRGDGGDAEALVDLGAARVVDARHDVLDAVLLARDAGGEDVRVVAARDGGEGVGVVDAGGPQGVAVEADPGDGAPLERGAEATERGLVLVDDGDLVTRRARWPGRGRRRRGRSP